MTHDESPAAAAAATTINRDPGGPVPCLCVVGMHRLHSSSSDDEQLSTSAKGES